jgi:hypothetical protein
MKRFLLLLLFTPLLAWAATIRTDLDHNPILNQFSEEGFVDCVFRIAERTETPDHYRLKLRASFEGQVVGMDVDVIKNIQGAFNSDYSLQKERVYRSGVVFRRTGPESDRLVAALASQYGQPKSGIQMISAESFTAIALHEGTLDMEQQPVKIKIFGRDSEPYDESAYYESFFNLDLKNGFVFWNEKDQEYRRPLIRALAGEQK